MDDKNSTSGYIFMMAEGAILWKSVKQALTASSTMEVEYVACYETTCHVMWLQNFISALGWLFTPFLHLKLFCDNSIAISFSRNTRSTSCFKHIDVKYFS